MKDSDQSDFETFGLNVIFQFHYAQKGIMVVYVPCIFKLFTIVWTDHKVSAIRSSVGFDYCHFSQTPESMYTIRYALLPEVVFWGCLFCDLTGVA